MWAGGRWQRRRLLHCHDARLCGLHHKANLITPLPASSYQTQRWAASPSSMPWRPAAAAAVRCARGASWGPGGADS